MKICHFFTLLLQAAIPASAISFTDIFKAGIYLDEASLRGPEQKSEEGGKYFPKHCDLNSFQYAAKVNENSIQTLPKPNDPNFFQKYVLHENGQILDVELRFGDEKSHIKQQLALIHRDDSKLVYRTTQGRKFTMTFAKDGEHGLHGYATMGVMEKPHGEFKLTFVDFGRRGL